MNVVANEWTATGICVAPAWDATNAKATANFSGAVEVEAQVTGDGAKATALHVEGQGRKVHPTMKEFKKMGEFFIENFDENNVISILF